MIHQTYHIKSFSFVFILFSLLSCDICILKFLEVKDILALWTTKDKDPLQETLNYPPLIGTLTTSHYNS